MSDFRRWPQQANGPFDLKMLAEAQAYAQCLEIARRDPIGTLRTLREATTRKSRAAQPTPGLYESVAKGWEEHRTKRQHARNLGEL